MGWTCTDDRRCLLNPFKAEWLPPILVLLVRTAPPFSEVAVVQRGLSEQVTIIERKSLRRDPLPERSPVSERFHSTENIPARLRFDLARVLQHRSRRVPSTHRAL